MKTINRRGRARAPARGSPARGDASGQTPARACDHPGCLKDGLYRAPRSREAINTYYWFCIDHVKAYNAQWDYCKGMSYEQVEREIRNSIGGDRPTWPTRQRVSTRAFVFGVDHPLGMVDEILAQTRQTEGRPQTPSPRLAPEIQAAMKTLDVVQPLTRAGLKARYKVLVKRYHPDANGGDPMAEERFKQITTAYALLNSTLKD